MATVIQAKQNKEYMKQFVQQHIGLIKLSIKKLGLPITEDYFQEGCIGLITAVKRFNPEYGTLFSTYAVPMIQGQIRRFRRDFESNTLTGVKVPRAIRELYFRSYRLEGKGYSDAEICDLLGITLDELQKVRLAIQFPASLDFKVNGGDGEGKESELHEFISCDYDIAEEATENVFRQQFLDQLFNSLNERQSLVLHWHLRGLPQEEIGEKIGKSQAQVSRMLKKIIQKGKAIAEGRIKTDMRKPKITAEQLLNECREHGTDDEALQLIAGKYDMTLGSIKFRIYKDKIKQKLRLTEGAITAAKATDKFAKHCIKAEDKHSKMAHEPIEPPLKPSAWDGKECTYTFRDGRLIIANKNGNEGTIAIQDFAALINEIKELQRIREVG